MLKAGHRLSYEAAEDLGGMETIVSLKKLVSAFVVVLSMVVAVPKFASASTMTFTCLSNNSGACSSIDQFFYGTATVANGQLTVDIFNDGSNGVIGQAYADFPDPQAGLFSLASVSGSATTSYSSGLGNFPEGNNATPPFDEDYGAQANPPAPSNGALDTEYVRFVFTLLNNQTQADIDDLFADNLIRFALHVQSLEIGEGAPEGGYSEALISQFVRVDDQCANGTCATTPEPASMLLLGTGLLAVARARSKKTV